MKELYQLAIMLRTMGMYSTSLEVSYEMLQYYKEEVDKFSENVIYSNTDNPNSPPGFTIQLRGVKMYINCPSVSFERE